MLLKHHSTNNLRLEARVGIEPKKIANNGLEMRRQLGGYSNMPFLHTTTENMKAQQSQGKEQNQKP